MRGLEEVVEHCKIAALWSSYDLGADEPLDENHIIEDMADDADIAIREMCMTFMQRAEDLLDIYPMGWPQLGHDIWLTVNGHGAGFLDRLELTGVMAYRLDAIAEGLPEIDLYIGDDGKIHV